MDRKGKQKVKFICLFLGAIALIVIVFVCKVISENRIFEEQKKGIIYYLSGDCRWTEREYWILCGSEYADRYSDHGGAHSADRDRPGCYIFFIDFSNETQTKTSGK